MNTKRLIIALGVQAAIAISGFSGFAAAADRCDRWMDNYLAALVKHDPSAVPFAKNVKFVENTASIPVGDGLWVTSAAGPTDFKIYAADPVAGQVACIVMMKENETIADDEKGLAAGFSMFYHRGNSRR